MKMHSTLIDTIEHLDPTSISIERQQILVELINFIEDKLTKKEAIQLNFICTHNSRRSHLAQIWAQALAFYFKVPNCHCYSGGTEVRALYPMVIKTLKNNGFQITSPVDGTNPKHTISFASNASPISGFSKKWNDVLNPSSNFAAVMTCEQAATDCPFIPGAAKKIALSYADPKAFDNSPIQAAKYQERSLQIATELFYVFSKLNIHVK